MPHATADLPLHAGRCALQAAAVRGDVAGER